MKVNDLEWARKKVLYEAEKRIRLYHRVIARLQEIQPGDLYYWKKMQRLVKVITITCPEQTALDPDLVGRVEVKVLAEETWGDTRKILTASYHCIDCVEWEKASVKDFPLYMNHIYKSREFYRLLSMGAA